MSSEMKLGIVIQAMDKFTAPARQISTVSDAMAKKFTSFPRGSVESIKRNGK